MEGNRKIKEVLGPSGFKSRANIQRDELGDIDIPDPVYESTRTREHGETVPSAHFRVFIGGRHCHATGSLYSPRSRDQTSERLTE